MRRTTLSPPRTTPKRAAGLPAADPSPSRPPSRDSLEPASPATERRRPLFHPKRGWFRRLERYVSNYLSASVFPNIPGIHRPYDRQLRRGLTLSEAEIALQGLPQAFDGARLLLISDVHAGPFVSPERLQETFRRLSAAEPDVIVLAGDLVTSRLVEFDSNRRAFESLRAPLGVYAVLGNHDHYTEDPAALAARVESCGIPVLTNRAISLERAGETLSLAGVDDLLVGEVDLDAALRGTAQPTIVISHNPDLFFEAARRGVALVLSGHTHGGQIRLPGLPVLVRQSRFRLDGGRYRTQETELVVSRGLGAVGLPWRMHCPPEAVSITLRRSRRRDD